MKRFISFREIGQFRNTIRNVSHNTRYIGLDEDNKAIYDNNIELPTLTFTGTVKSHGTNSGFSVDSEGNVWYQSRKRIITPEKDNAGFAFFCKANENILKELNDDIREKCNLQDKVITIFGEWIGQGIQKGVAIAELSKRFIIFNVKISNDEQDGESYYLNRKYWKHLKSEEHNIYNVNDFKMYSIEIDFNNPKLIQNKLAQYTEEVENQCPIGKAFGVDGIGEGIVWVSEYKGVTEMFKTKGTKHSSSKVKKIASVDIDKLNSINEFVEYSVTENRLNQAIEQVFTSNGEQVTIKKTGDFLRWMINDIIKEESDTLAENKLEPKDVNRSISAKAKNWFNTYLNKQVGLN